MRVLTISAKARHGKDLCAKIAQQIAKEEFGKNLVIWSFAHPLKALVYGEGAGLLSFADVWENKPPEVRRRLQLRGTEEGRLKFGEDVWTLQSEAYLRIFDSWGGVVDGVVFPDARFPNEVEFGLLGGRVPSRVLAEIREAVTREMEFTAELEDQLLYEDPAGLLALESELYARIDERYNDQLRDSSGMAIRIKSDRPTLSGEAALHPSETSLDHLPDTAFSAVIENYQTNTLEDLGTQLRPVVGRLLNFTR